MPRTDKEILQDRVRGAEALAQRMKEDNIRLAARIAELEANCETMAKAHLADAKRLELFERAASAKDVAIAAEADLTLQCELQQAHTRIAELESQNQTLRNDAEDSDLIFGIGWRESVEIVNGVRQYNKEKHVGALVGRIHELEEHVERLTADRTLNQRGND